MDQMSQQAEDLQDHEVEPTAVNAPRPPSFRISGDRAALFSALAAAQAEFSAVETNRTAQVKSDKANYTFDYADLATLQKATRPGLNANGLTITQPYWEEKGGFVLITILAHSSGASMECEVWIPRTEKIQQLGSALTYHQRYQWRGICGISSEKEDDDGNQADGNKANIQHQHRQRQQQPPAPQPRQQQSKPVTQQQKPAESKLILTHETPAQEPGMTEELQRQSTGNEPQPFEHQGQQTLPQADERDKSTPPEKASGGDAVLPASSAEIRKLCQQFKMNKDDAVALCHSATGRGPDKQTEAEAQKMLACMRDGGWMARWMAARRGGTAA